MLLIPQGGTIAALSRAMLAEPADTPTRQNLLGALQKLTLRRAAQTMLIEIGTTTRPLIDPSSCLAFSLLFVTLLPMVLRGE